MPPAAHVLQDFGKAEQPLVAEILDEAVRAAQTFLREGIDRAMTRHNTARAVSDG
jgi:peptidyl-tRNA hydrolase